MTEGLSENIAKKLRHLCFDIQDTSYKDGVRIKMGVDGSFALSQNGGECLEKTISVIKKKISSVDIKVSDKFLEDLIMKSVVNLSNFERSEVYDHALVETNKIISEVSTGYKEFMVMTPLINFQSEVEKITVGNVEFSSVDADYFSIIKYPTDSPIEDVINSFIQKIVAQTTVETKDKGKAKEVGLAQIDLALDTIRFYGLYVFGSRIDFLKNRFDREGHIFAGNSIEFIYDKAIGVGGIGFEREGYLYPFNFSKDFPEIMSKANFSVLDAILKKDDTERTEFEKRIILAIRLMGSSFMSYENDEAFLKMIIALESLLLADNEPPRVNISERVALIITTKLENRLKTFCMMKKLYKIRNNIVHSGLKNVTLTKRTQLQYFTTQCILSILGRYQTENIRTITDFIKMINKLKFSGGFPPE